MLSFSTGGMRLGLGCCCRIKEILSCAPYTVIFPKSICFWGQGGNSWSKASAVIFRPGLYLNSCYSCQVGFMKKPHSKQVTLGCLVQFSLLCLQVGTQQVPSPSSTCSASVPARTSSPTACLLLWWAVHPRPWTCSWRAMPLHSLWLPKPNGEGAISGWEQGQLC